MTPDTTPATPTPPTFPASATWSTDLPASFASASDALRAVLARRADDELADAVNALFAVAAEAVTRADALAADLARVTVERDAAVARAAELDAEHLEDMAFNVRARGHEDANGRVDSGCLSDVADSMRELAAAGRMSLEPDSEHGRYIFGQWVRP